MKNQLHIDTKADLSFNLRHFWPMKSYRRPRLQRKTDSHFKISDAVHNMLGTYFHCIFSSKDKISNSCRLWFWKWSWTIICFIARISGCSLAAPIITPISIGINSNTSGFEDNWVYAKKPRRNKIVCLNSKSWAPCILNPDQEETFPKNRKLYFDMHLWVFYWLGYIHKRRTHVFDLPYFVYKCIRFNKPQFVNIFVFSCFSWIGICWINTFQKFVLLLCIHSKIKQIDILTPFRAYVFYGCSFNKKVKPNGKIEKQ